jgi:hypothetical protein
LLRSSSDLRDILARIATHPAKRINELLPWAWAAARTATTAAASSTARSIQPQTP